MPPFAQRSPSILMTLLELSPSAADPGGILLSAMTSAAAAAVAVAAAAFAAAITSTPPCLLLAVARQDDVVDPDTDVGGGLVDEPPGFVSTVTFVGCPDREWRRYWGVAHRRSFRIWIMVLMSRLGRPNRSCSAGFKVPV